MSNSAIEIPFFVTCDGAALTGAAAEMGFAQLRTLSGVDKINSAPAVSEIGGGWYKFAMRYGEAPFDDGDLVGVIDADKNSMLGLANAERFIPVEVRLDFYALGRLVNNMSQNKTTGSMEIKDRTGQTILTLAIEETEEAICRNAV